jgi:hypothetical protein
MKNIWLGIIFVLLVGCSDHIDVGELDIILIESDAVSILDSNVVDIADLPITLANLKPESVMIRNDGLYIKLSGFFVNEKGLFVPIDRSTDYSSIGTDPEYKRLSGNVYSYIIRG